MKIQLEGMTVYFPYEYIYPEQYQYMLSLKRALDRRGHCLLEMPTGTGKTITLLSLITSYQLANPTAGKLIYCTRTVPEMEKVLQELHELITYRARYFPEGNAPKILALGLSSRKNLCVHPVVADEGSRESVDSGCRRLTASWVRDRAQHDPDIETCEFFEGLEQAGPDGRLDAGVYSMHDLRVLGRKKKWCPYFLARHMIAFANVVVYSYQYMIDPKVSQMVSREMEKECVVVFDEAHNIDNVCIEALSVNLRQQTLDRCTGNLNSLDNAITRLKQTDAQRLRDEYQRLVSNLQAQGAVAQGDEVLANPVLPADILNEAVPGNIRRAEHFVAFMRRFVSYLRSRMRVTAVESESPATFLAHVQSSAYIDGKTLRFCYDRLSSLLKTLEISNTEDYTPIHLVADFATLVGTYSRGFAIIIEPFDERMPSVPDPVIQLSCLDASLAMKPVFTKYQTVVITSGTLSPIDLYPKILAFNPVVVESLNMTLTRDCLCPVVLTRGSDQGPISTKFDMRNDPVVIRNYGRLLVELASVVPDGIVCFFVSYHYMDTIVSKWNDMGILQELMSHKLLFIETQDVVETTLALDNFRRACDCGRGAVFFSVARGKVAEGIDFDRHYGRCVVMMGVPYQYTLSRILRARLEYLRETFQLNENDYLAFDAVRQSAQCVGRVIRSKADYGLMVFADKRYMRHDKRSKLPTWITSNLKDAHMNLSTDMLMHVVRDFMRNMAQPYDSGIIGKSLLSEEQHAQLCDQQIALSQMLQYLEQQSPAEKKHLVRGVEGVRITSTGFSGVMRSVIKHVARAVGMQYNGALTADTHAVIAAVDNMQPSAKLLAARDHGIPVIHVQWLADTLALRAVQTWEPYMIVRPDNDVPRAPPPSPPEEALPSRRISYSSIELLRYNASPSDPRSMASVLRAARVMDDAVCDAATHQAPGGLLSMREEACRLSPPTTQQQETHMLVSGHTPTVPRVILDAVHQRHGPIAKPIFYNSLHITPPAHTSRLSFTLDTPQYVPLVLPDDQTPNTQTLTPNNTQSLAAVRLQAIYELDNGEIWLLHQYYLNQSDLNLLPGGPIPLRAHELVLRKKRYNSPAASIRGAAVVYGSRSAHARWGGRHADTPVYFCEKTHAE